MRLMLFKLLCLLSSLFVGGCMSPIVAHDDGGDDETDVNKPDPLHVDGSSPTVTMTVGDDAYQSILAFVGKGNAVTFDSPIHIERPEVTIDMQAGSKVTYIFNDERGVVTFSKPLPKLHAAIPGTDWKIVPTGLNSLTIKPDGSGTAATGLGKYSFRWMGEDDAGSAAAANELPEVWAYSQPGCPPCVRARLELAAEKELQFKVIWKDEAAPAWLQSRPAFWWHVTGDKPSQEDVSNTRQATGWNGIRDFVERWKASRTPKKYKRAVASNSLSYHSGHDCPSCGREQYVIASDDGPNHTHRCDKCGTSWYHADAKQRSFLGWTY